MLSLVDVVEALTGKYIETGSQVITDAVVDSRRVIPGALFVALPGERTDGHDYVAAAFEKGALLALVQREVPVSIPVVDLRQADSFHPEGKLHLPLCLLVEDSLLALQQVARVWRRKKQVRVIGITGSVGKSTTKELTAEVLSRRYRTLKNPGNLNNEIGLPLTILRLGSGYERVVLEMGFYVPGEIALLCDLALPQVGVVTNIGMVHAERAGSMEAIARGKAELVEALPPAPDGVAILNYDDEWVKPMAEKTQARVFYYGLNPKAELWADAVESEGLNGVRFKLHYQNETLHIHVPLIGHHSIHTALRAAAVGLVEGLTWQEIIDGLQAGHSQLRLITVRTKTGALLLDDTYNASPESTMAALNLLRELEGRRVAILGDMLELGIYEKHGHEMVGARAAQVVDELITVGKRARIIAQAALSSGLKSERVSEFLDCDEAIQFLNERLGENDVVLVKGSRGMRMDRIVAALEYRQ